MSQTLAFYLKHGVPQHQTMLVYNMLSKLSKIYWRREDLWPLSLEEIYLL